MFWYFLALFSIQNTAWGHAGDILDSLDVEFPPDSPNGVLLESSIGALWSPEGSDFEWLCHEAVTKPDSLLAPRYIVGPNQTLLAALPKAGEGRDAGVPMYRTTDRCSWSPVSGLDNYAVMDMAYDVPATSVVYAVANHVDNTGDNGLFISSDDGQTWTLSSLRGAEPQFRSILITEDHIWASAVNFGTQQGWVYRSSDKGSTWDTFPLDLSTYASPPDLRLGTVTEERLWFVVTQTLEDELWALDGTSFSIVSQADTKIMNMASIGAELYLTLWNQGIARWTGTTLARIDASPKSYAVRSRGTRLYAATRPLFTENGLMTSENGGPFEANWAYSDLKPPPVCPADSDSARACEPLWETLEARLIPAPVDTGGDSSDTGEPPEKSCGGNKAWLLFFLPLTLFRRLHGTQHRL